jgi:hypothetical protein
MVMSGVKTILSLCDYSGAWSKPYKDAGYNVIQVDLKLGWDVILWPSMPSKQARLPRHFTDIVESWKNIFYSRPYGILAAPVCTYFSASGARHRRTDEQIKEGLALVDACIRIAWVTKPKFFCLENPVGKLSKWIGPPVYRFQPSDYGDNYTKKTCLWGYFNIPPKTPVIPTQGSKMHLKYGGKSDRTKELRSITPAGFAEAFFKVNQ